MCRSFFPALLILVYFLNLKTQAESQSSKQGPPAFRVYSRLVLLDVTVTDGKGKPVHGLKRSDFHVFDNNRPQQFSFFEEHVAGLKTSNESAVPPEAGSYSNEFLIHPPPVFNVILIDTNTIDIADQMYLSDQLKRFVGELPAHEPVAIYHRWGDYTMLLQNFTADHELLMAAVRKAIPRLRIPGHATYTDLDTLKQILAYLGTIPGRKNVLWFTGGSNLFLLPDPTGTELEYESDLRDIYDQLEADRISLYPIDARGLVNVGASMRENMGMLEQHGLMKDMAVATGGRAYYNDNGLAQITTQVVSDDGSYYTLTYSPDDLHLDNKWHKLKVKVDEPSCELSYRQGYFDDGLNPATTSPKHGDRTVLRAGDRTERIPDNHAEPIIFEADVFPAKDLLPAMIGQVPNPPQRPPKRGEITYTIHYMVPLNAFVQGTSGLKQTFKAGAAFMAFDQYGGRLGWLSQTLNLSFDEKQGASEQSKAAFDQSVNLPIGNDYLYLVIWDATTGRIGSLEVPVEVKKTSK